MRRIKLRFFGSLRLDPQYLIRKLARYLPPFPTRFDVIGPALMPMMPALISFRPGRALSSSCPSSAASMMHRLRFLLKFVTRLNSLELTVKPDRATTKSPFRSRRSFCISSCDCENNRRIGGSSNAMMRFEVRQVEASRDRIDCSDCLSSRLFAEISPIESSTRRSSAFVLTRRRYFA
jgi:hypothetical protein